MPKIHYFLKFGITCLQIIECVFSFFKNIKEFSYKKIIAKLDLKMKIK
ncbi:hypothetical protein SAMN05192553_101598 [Cyclobacterium xiamenense]|uniref:Uncharacterized protein n=1 Tax=Cyclobacterium xiamenense TaxID=1297121 RepID=A0A1H6U2H6_9BACT|nr:hypothetical protein SAMN05192553_101598 [Cyclobacterium xiamenense]